MLQFFIFVFLQFPAVPGWVVGVVQVLAAKDQALSMVLINHGLTFKRDDLYDDTGFLEYIH